MQNDSIVEIDQSFCTHCSYSVCSDFICFCLYPSDSGVNLILKVDNINTENNADTETETYIDTDGNNPPNNNNNKKKNADADTDTDTD